MSFPASDGGSVKVFVATQPAFSISIKFESACPISPIALLKLLRGGFANPKPPGSKVGPAPGLGAGDAGDAGGADATGGAGIGAGLAEAIGVKVKAGAAAGASGVHVPPELETQSATGVLAADFAWSLCVQEISPAHEPERTTSEINVRVVKRDSLES